MNNNCSRLRTRCLEHSLVTPSSTLRQNPSSTRSSRRPDKAENTLHTFNHLLSHSIEVRHRWCVLERMDTLADIAAK